MSTIEKYKQEIETELDHTREKFIELKTKIRGFSDAKRLESIEEVEELEKMASDMRTKLNELSEEMEDSWKQIKDDIDSSRSTIDEAFARLNRSLV
jgi:predicted  nucleic acid-binding Zn-ribbon protein